MFENRYWQLSDSWQASWIDFDQFFLRKTLYIFRLILQCFPMPDFPKYSCTGERQNLKKNAFSFLVLKFFLLHILHRHCRSNLTVMLVRHTEQSLLVGNKFSELD